MGRPSKADEVQLPTKRGIQGSRDNFITRREGKKLVFEIGFLCQIVAFVCLFISFASPYWIVSWPRVYSGFKVT